MPPRDPAALRAAPERLLADQGLRTLMGRSARAWAWAALSWTVATETTGASYREAASFDECESR